MPDNRIFAFVGTTAAGKTYYSKHLVKKYGMNYIPSVTSRPPRPGNLSEYKHVSKAEFERLINENMIFEYTVFNGHYYGKLHDDIETNLMESHCVYTITADRVAELKTKYPKTVVLCITIENPLIKNTIKRLVDRGHGHEEILSKIKTVEQDMTDIRMLHDAGLVNHTIETIQGDKTITFRQLDDIIDNL